VVVTSAAGASIRPRCPQRDDLASAFEWHENELKGAEELL
jgi:hypothetical protein